MLYDFKLTKTPSSLDFDIQLDPGKRLYCLIGENGVGKTSLLEGLGAVLFAGHAMWADGPSTLGSFRTLGSKAFLADLSQRNWYLPDVVVSGQGLKNESWGYAEFRHMRRGLSRAIVDRPLAYVSSSGRAETEPLLAESIRLTGSIYDDLVATITRNLDAIERRAPQAKALAAWLASRLIVDPAFIVGLRRPHEQVGVLLELLQAFDPKHFDGIIRKHADGRRAVEVAFHAADATLRFKGVPIERLASGYLALIRIFQEIVDSLAAWEGIRNKADILASDALILIDEIDAHLHPRWQAKLLPFLKESFPNATFVVTTHSPIMVQSTETGEGYELVKTGQLVTSRRLGSPRDWYWSDVLEEAFHVELPLPGAASPGGQPELVDQLLELTRLVQEFTSTRDSALRDQALELYDQVHGRLLDDDPRRNAVEDLRSHLG